MKNKLPMAARLLLGVIFFVFGLNGFLQFLPQPPLPEAATNFFGALYNTGYFLPFLKGSEVIAGAMLLGNIAAPVALLILSPIVLNIFLFHAVLTPGAQNLFMPVVIIALQLVAASAYWNKYAPLFKKSA